MLQYPSIPGFKKISMGNHCIAFYKHDGSNLRFEYSHKKGWHKFGSRTQLIDTNSPILGQGIDLFMEKQFGEIIIDRLKAEYGTKAFKAMEKITAFAEFYGNKSFAGSHVEDDPKKLTLFDVHLFKKGFILPQSFADMFEDIGAKVVYKGILNESFVRKVRTNDLICKLTEGVICKGLNTNEQVTKYNEVWMAKIKTQAYLDKLHATFNDQWENFAE